MTGLPLEGVRICDIGLVWAGPFCTMQLADWGAEVVRAESRHFFTTWDRGSLSVMITRDLIEAMRFDGQYLYMYADAEPGDEPWNRYNIFNSLARNKLSMTVEFSSPRGKDILGRLIEKSDIVIENRPRTQLEKFGITYEWMKNIRSDIIYIRMPPFGLTGPLRDTSMLGPYIDMICGHSLLRGYPELTPDRVPINHYTDSTGGRYAALALLLALEYRDRTGKGQLIDLGQIETLLVAMPEPLMDYTMNERIQESMGNRHPVYAPCGVYRCKAVSLDQRYDPPQEDAWIAITVCTEKEWEGLCQVMGNPAWTHEERFADTILRYQNQDDMDSHIETWTRQHDPHALMHLLQSKGVPAGVVCNEADLLNDSHLKDRDFWQELTQKEVGTYLYHGPWFKMSKTPNRLRLPPCRLGEHNEYVYKQILGVTDQEYEELEKTGHIGTKFEIGVPFEG